MSQKQSYLTPLLWFIGTLPVVQFAFVLTVLGVSAAARAALSTLPSMTLALASAAVSTIVIGIASGLAADRLRAPEWVVIPAVMGVLWSRFPATLASIFGLQPGGAWAWMSLALAIAVFGIATESARWLMKRRSASAPTASAFGFSSLLRHKGLLAGLGIALAFNGFRVWMMPSDFVGIPPLPSGRHDAVYFDRLPVELVKGRLDTTIAQDDAPLGRYVRHSIHTDTSTTFLFDEKKVSAQEFLRLSEEDGYVDSVVAGQDGLLLRVEGLPYGF